MPPKPQAVGIIQRNRKAFLAWAGEFRRTLMQTTFELETIFSNIATSFSDLKSLDQSFESTIQTYATEVQKSVTKMRNLTQLISGQLDVRAL